MSDFSGEWQAWRDAREERLRDPHGWLAITAIHWLTDERRSGSTTCPGEWAGDERRRHGHPRSTARPSLTENAVLTEGVAPARAAGRAPG